MTKDFITKEITVSRNLYEIALVTKLILVLLSPIFLYVLATVFIAVLAIIQLSLSAIYFDVSNKPKYSSLTDPLLETQEDLFLFQWSDRSYALGAINCIYLPSSIEVYKNNPENWMYVDAWAEERQKPNYFHAEKVIDIVPKGTHLKIVKIMYCPFDGTTKGYFARLDNEKFSKHLVIVDSFLKPCTLDKVPKINTTILKPVVCEPYSETNLLR